MHIKPKKRLGQLFLTDQNIQRKIIEYCQLRPKDIVLEIGAGRGELTRLVAERVNRVYALEIDYRLYENLKDNLKNYLNIEVLKQDILRFNLKKCFARKRKIKVVGNIPYYISSPIIEQLLKYRNMIDSIFITVQKEFGNRIVALAGSKDYGSLSCFVQYYSTPKILFAIKKTCFSPRPQVDSCFLKLEIRRKPLLALREEKLLFKIIRASFNKRRKILRNSLKNIVPAGKLTAFFNEYNIRPDIRPENLPLQDFFYLTKSIL